MIDIIGEAKTMESKAQKAAIEEIRRLINQPKDIIVKADGYYDTWDRIDENIDRIERIIEEYGLKNRLDMIQLVYDTLMKKERYERAASFAKKYGL
jgi:hypothetical protein